MLKIKSLSYDQVILDFLNFSCVIIVTISNNVLIFMKFG